MKLDDPFGRVEKRNQLSYESMRDSLSRGNINSPRAAFEVIRQSRKRAFKVAGAAGLLFALTALLLPQAVPTALILMVLLIIWLINSFINGQRYIKRYIKEELENTSVES